MTSSLQQLELKRQQTLDDILMHHRLTAFAAPLVAARLSTFYPRQSPDAVEAAVRKLMAEAIDLGKKGYDPIYGHGLVCGNCGR